MTRLEIEAFLTIIQTGSISAAAARLYVSQPALSRRIRAIEEELGYELFIRGKGVKTVTLTNEGNAFVSIAEKFIHLYREAGAVSSLNQPPILNLSAISSVSTYLLPSILKQMVTEEKRINLAFHNFHSREAYTYMESGMLDLALISDDIYSKEVITSPAFQEPFVLLGGPGFGGRDSVHPSELNPSCEVRLPWNPEFDAWHEKWFDITVAPKVRLDQMTLLEEFLTGDNFAVVPLLVARRIRNRDLTLCCLQEGPPDEIIYYLTRGRGKQEIIRYFLSLLHKELQKLDGIQSFLSD